MHQMEQNEVVYVPYAICPVVRFERLLNLIQWLSHRIVQKYRKDQCDICTVVKSILDLIKMGRETLTIVVPVHQFQRLKVRHQKVDSSSPLHHVHSRQISGPDHKQPASRSQL